MFCIIKQMKIIIITDHETYLLITPKYLNLSNSYSTFKSIDALYILASLNLITNNLFPIFALMKSRFISFCLFVYVGLIIAMSSCGQPAQSSDTHKNEIACDDTLWNHVYHKYRLTIIEQCKTVRGVIVKEKNEKDGDIHILLRLDAGQDNLLNDMNIKQQKGCLVIEPICEHDVTQRDAIGACEGYVNKVYIPHVGEHVEVTGSYVNDTQHGWNEIHPITKITIIK